MSLIREEVNRRRIRALATADSPAVLDALKGDEHRDVVVCLRDSSGVSRLTRLVDLPSYADIIAKGGLGSAATRDRLREGVLGPPARRRARRDPSGRHGS